MRTLKEAALAKIERLPKLAPYIKMSASEFKRVKPITRKMFLQYKREFINSFKASEDYVPDFTRTIIETSKDAKRRIPVYKSFDPVREFAEVKFYESKLQDDLYAKNHIVEIRKMGCKNAKNEFKSVLKSNAKKIQNILESQDIKKSILGVAGNYRKIKKFLLGKVPTKEGSTSLGLLNIFQAEEQMRQSNSKLHDAREESRKASNMLAGFQQENAPRLKRADQLLEYYRNNFAERAKAFGHRAKREIGLATIKSTATRPRRELLALLHKQRTQESEIDKIVNKIIKHQKTTLNPDKQYVQ